MEATIKRKINIPELKVEKRPWGRYEMLAENKRHTTKVLYIKKNEMLSLQVHMIRDQLYYIIDNMTVFLSDRPIPEGDVIYKDRLIHFANKHVFAKEYTRGDIIKIPKYVLHRPAYYGNREYGIMLDLAFNFNDERDIVRVQDKYGRQ